MLWASSRRVDVPIIEKSEKVIARSLSGQIWNANDYRYTGYLFQLKMDGRKRTAGPAHIVLISQDHTAFPFLPLARTYGGDFLLMAPAEQYIQRIRNAGDSLYGGEEQEENIHSGPDHEQSRLKPR
jgi:hypothetical protein